MSGIFQFDPHTGKYSAPPLQDFGLWVCFNGKIRPDYDSLRQCVFELGQMMTQKTAGQPQYAKAGDIDVPENLERVKMTILMEAVLLVLHGDLDRLEETNGADRK